MKKADLARKILFILWFLAGATFFIYFSYQNTFFNQDRGLSFFREWDDYYFHIVVQDILKDWSKGHLLASLQHSHFGYGQLFWFLNSLAVAPGWLAGSEVWMVMAPRMLSTVLAIASLGLMARIFFLLSGNFSASLILSLFPMGFAALPFAALRFHNISLLLFLGLLSFWLALSAASGPRWRLESAALAFGFCVGTKIIGLFLAPSLAWVIWQKLEPDQRLPQLLKLSGIFLISFLVSFQPLLLFFPWMSDFAEAFLQEFRGHLSRARSGFQWQAASDNFKWGLSSFYYSVSTWVLMAVSVVQCFFSHRRDSKSGNSLVFFLNALIVALYLIFFNQQGPTYTAAYFFPLLFLPLPVLLSIGSWKGGALVLAAALGFQAYSQRSPVEDWSRIYEKRWFSPEFQSKLEARQQMRALIGAFSGQPKTVCRSPAGIFPWSRFDPEVTEVIFNPGDPWPAGCLKADFLSLTPNEPRTAEFEQLPGKQKIFSSPVVEVWHLKPGI